MTRRRHPRANDWNRQAGAWLQRHEWRRGLVHDGARAHRDEREQRDKGAERAHGGAVGYPGGQAATKIEEELGNIKARAAQAKAEA